MKVKSESEVVPDPQRPHGLQPFRLLPPWDFPGKSTGVGCHCLLRGNQRGLLKHWWRALWRAVTWEWVEVAADLGICAVTSPRCTWATDLAPQRPTPSSSFPQAPLCHRGAHREGGAIPGHPKGEPSPVTAPSVTWASGQKRGGILTFMWALGSFGNFMKTRDWKLHI